MATLLEISDDIAALQSLIESAQDIGAPDAEIQAAIDAWLAQIKDDIESKADNYIALARSLELQAAARREEMDRLTKSIAADENKVKWLMGRLCWFMEQNKLKKIRTRRYNITLCNNGGVQPMEPPEPDPNTLPAEFIYLKPTADKRLIRSTLESGGKVPGCRLLERGKHLRIT